jgi:hypothetical protein
MILAIILVIAAAFALGFIVWATISRSLRNSDPSLAGTIQPIDIEAFRNLVDPAENEYLRRRLPAAEFRRVRRQRLRAMAAYVKTAGKNAAVLSVIAQRALIADDPQTAAAAQRLADSAILLRHNAAIALFRIQVARAWPNSGPEAVPILPVYEQLSGAAMLLGRLQNPATPVRLSARS